MPYKKPKRQPFAELEELLRGNKLNSTSLAKVLVCSPTTALKKLNNPELLTLKDLGRIVRFGHIPEEKVKQSLILRQ